MEVTVTTMSGRSRTDLRRAAQGRALAERLRAQRMARRLSRAELAAASGISARVLSGLESGTTTNPGFFTIAAVAATLGIGMDELLADVGRAPTGGLVSAGYEGLRIDQFVDALRACGVQTVADVRMRPQSQFKPDFSKTRLTAHLAKAGIEYWHLRALGNPKDNRPPFYDGRVDEGRAVYSGVLDGAEATEQLQQLFAAAEAERVAVLCLEREEQRCHRQVILDRARSTPGLSVAPLA